MAEKTNPDAGATGPSFLSIFLIVGRLLLVYAKRLLNLDTLVSLEKKQGNGSGEKSEEVVLYERALERNSNNYHFTNEQLGSHMPQPIPRPEDIVLVVKGDKK